MNLIFEKYKFLLVPAALAIFLFGGLLAYRHFSRPKYVAIPPRPEINITIIPGWNLRQIAMDWQAKGLIKSPDELYDLVGKPAFNYKAHHKVAPVLDFVSTSSFDYFFVDKSKYLSYEGYFLPDTYRVYADASATDVIKKIFNHLDEKITPEMRASVASQHKNFGQILTMASVVEKEAPTSDSMSMVADIFWRRLKAGWPLQSCATVNYITGKNDPAASAKDKLIDSLYNTYLYPGLPPAPISNPSLNAIKAVIYPIKNDYWYFMSGTDGQLHFAKTLDEHNRNVYKFLR
ncbi:MAG: endolytic transglycosylase MltG [Candidatus Magasanikbacteria bacterium]|nr:endolytic transglycosylase MltG [Candidatus Magasanikbacteria bacterium]